MRGRRQDRREERQAGRGLGRRGSDKNRYKMREKLVSFGDDFWIENEAGQDDVLILAVTVCIDQMVHG